MKKITMLALVLFAVAKAHAQDYLLSFSGKGASTTFDSIKIENITQNTSITVPGGYQLRLLGTVTAANTILADTKSALRIYPNPASEFSTVEFDVLKAGIGTVEVFDFLGKQLGRCNRTLQAEPIPVLSTD
jgi:hypothetical protein